MTSRIALVVLLTGSISASSAVGCAADRGTNARVQRGLAAHPEVDRFEIDVDTRGGVATLRGTVETLEAKQAAEEIALKTEGVDRVDNQLVVKQENLSDWADKYGSDFVIRTKVGSKLTADPDVRRFGIDIDVEDGVVILSGSVETQSAKREAEKLAASVQGVRRVRNELEIARPYEAAQEVERPQPGGERASAR